MSKVAVANDRLRSFCERVERLEEEKKALTDDIKEVYAEAKGEGFDTKILRQIVRERKMDRADWQEQQAMLDLYRHKLGMLSDTPLGQAAMQRAPEQSRAERAKDRTSEAMADHKEVVKELAEAGLISPEAAEENAKLSDAVAEKYGNGIAPPIKRGPVRKVASDIGVQAALKKMGDPVPLTEEEKSKGYVAAFMKDGTRCALQFQPE